MSHIKKRFVFQYVCHCFILAMAFLACVSFLGCSSRKDAIADLSDFRKEVKEHSSEWDENQWNEAFSRLDEIDERLQEMQLSDSQRKEVIKIKVEIIGYIATVAAHEATDGLKNLADDMESFADGFSKTFEMPDMEE